MDTPTPTPEQTKQVVTASGTEQVPSDQPYPHLTEAEVEDIFRQALAELSPHLLVRPKTREEQAVERHFVLFSLLLLLSFAAGSVFALVTYSTVTITITPIAQSVALTMRLALVTRPIAPVTVMQAARAQTTGHGHQDARAATGTLLFYNGSATPQSVPGGSVFTGNDGVQVTTEQSITVPAANLPQIGTMVVGATALLPGRRGNIAAFDVDLALSTVLKVRNEAPFTNGRDARDYPAVAQRDLDALSATLRHALTQAIPHAFRLRPGQAVIPTACHLSTIADHGVGQEAPALTMHASETCQGIVYSQDQLQHQATTAFTIQTRPGAQYRLIGPVTTSITNLAPVTVQMRGLWVYHLSEDQEQWLAQQVAGDSPQQARAYLLRTGLFTRVSIPQPLPRDPQHIMFLVVVGGLEQGASA